MSEPLTFDEIFIGMRVRCINDASHHDRWGKFARIVAVRPTAITSRIIVEWEDGALHSTSWKYDYSFERAVPELKKFKKYSYVSPKKLRKLEREQMKAKAFLNA